MTIQEWINKQEEKLQKLQKENYPLAIASADTMAMQANRIFVEGGDSAGGKIGNYSTKTIYVNPEPKRFPKKFTPKGKEGQTKFKNGKPHKTKYFKDGYKEFREGQGRQSAFVDLKMVGDLQSDFANNAVISDKLPANIKPIKISVNEYHTTLKREKNIDKKDGNEKRFGTIFKLTKEERENFKNVAQLELKRAME